MFLVNSRLGLFAAAPSGSRSESVHPSGAPLLPKLRGQLAEFLDQGSPDRLSILYSPTCVGLRYGQRGSSLEAFLGGMGVRPLRLIRLGIAPQPCVGPGFAWSPAYTLTPGQPPPGLAYPSASPHRWPTIGRVGRPRRAFLSNPSSALALPHWYGNINPLSIGYASRPRLRSRLTLGGLAFPRKPWAFGGEVSRLPLATHAGIRTRDASTAGSPRRFARVTTLPYHPARLELPPKKEPEHMCEVRSFGTVLEPR